MATSLWVSGTTSQVTESYFTNFLWLLYCSLKAITIRSKDAACSSIGIAKFACREVCNNLYREVIPLTYSAMTTWVNSLKGTFFPHWKYFRTL